jgi:TPR repeat protein
MRNLTATLCLTLVVLLFSPTEGWSQDLQVGLDAWDRGDFATALREWTPLAEQGHASAQYNLGQMYREGEGVPQDDKTAAKWYTLAAEQGHVKAQEQVEILEAKIAAEQGQAALNAAAPAPVRQPVITVQALNLELFAQVDANVREGPETTTRILGTLATGARVKVTGQAEDWYRVALADGQVGFVLGRLLGPPEAPAGPSIFRAGSTTNPSCGRF